MEQRNEAVELTGEELSKMLDARIRRSASWKLRDRMPGYELGTSQDTDAVKKAASQVYDDILSDMEYSGNDNLVKAVRAIKNFTASYVARVIKNGLKAGTIQLEAEAMRGIEAWYTEAKKKGKEPPLGTGERFKKLSGKLKKKGVKDPKALAAYIGRKKFGKERFDKLSKKGKKK